MKYVIYLICLLLVFSACSTENAGKKQAEPIDETVGNVAYTQTDKIDDEEEQSVVIVNNHEDIWPPESAEYEYDINNDGIQEKILNLVYEGDTHEEAYILLQDKGLIGYVDWTDLPMPGLFYWGVNAVSTHFDEKEKFIFINYYDQVKEEYIKLKADSKLIKYVEYKDSEYPFIDIDKAFERFGNEMTLDK